MKLFINIRRMVEKYCKTKGRFWNFSQNKQRQSNGKQIFLSIVPDLRRTEMVWNEGSSKLCYGNGGTGDRNVLAVRNNVLEEIQISFLENFLWFILSPYYNPQRNDINDIRGMNMGAQTSHMTSHGALHGQKKS